MQIGPWFWVQVRMKHEVKNISSKTPLINPLNPKATREHHWTNEGNYEGDVDSVLNIHYLTERHQAELSFQ